MTFQRVIARAVRQRLCHPGIRKWLAKAETSFELARNTAFPQLVSPSPRNLTVAITAKCNLRCTGCRYGRDYMAGHELPTEMVKQLLRDASEAGISTVRLYGGEPLLHPGLNAIIAEAVRLGITPYVTTNGQNLNKHLDSMFDAGLRTISFGYYGSGETYDSYVGRRGAWRRFDGEIAAARKKYGDRLSLHVSYLLSTRTCSLAELQEGWEFADRYNLDFHVDLIHYSLPYFTEGPDRELQFTAADAPQIRTFVERLQQLKRLRPTIYRESDSSIQAIPDWLLKGPAMRVPCDAYEMIWVGADGSVRLCFVTFSLGNLHEKPLRELLFTQAHREAVAGALRLDCPNCHCRRESRMQKHLPSLLRYGLGIPSAAHRPAAAVSTPAADVFPIVGQR